MVEIGLTPVLVEVELGLRGVSTADVTGVDEEPLRRS